MRMRVTRQSLTMLSRYQAYLKLSATCSKGDFSKT